MSTVEAQSWLDVRIPQRLFDQLKTGAITIAMFITMACLYRWSDWHSGKVAYASAGGLRKATGDVYSLRMIQRAMKKLEEMGWITRHILEGSHEDYSVTIHNYKWIDENGAGQILNPKTSSAVSRKMTRNVTRSVTRKNRGEATVNAAISSLPSVDVVAEDVAEVVADGDDKILYKNEHNVSSIKNNVDLLSPCGDDARSLYSLLDDVWNHYITATHRTPRTRLTTIRKRIGIVRLRECLQKTGGNRDNAVRLMKTAIDALAKSDWHMGRDEKSDGKTYNDWEHAFGTYERMENWWNT